METIPYNKGKMIKKIPIRPRDMQIGAWTWGTTQSTTYTSIHLSRKWINK